MHFFYRILVCFSTIPTVKFRNKFLCLNSRLGFLFTWKGGKKYVQFFIAIQNWSIKDGKIFTFFKEPVKFPIFFIKFSFRIVQCVKKMWKSDMHSTCRICVPTLFSMLSRIFFCEIDPPIFSVICVQNVLRFSTCQTKWKKKKYLRPFQDYIMSVLTYLQNALSNYCIYFVFYFYFLFLTSLSV